MNLDDRLNTEQSFLCGEKLSLADIVIFNEVTLYMEIMGLDTDSEEIKDRAYLVKWLKTKMLNNISTGEAKIQIKTDKRYEKKRETEKRQKVNIKNKKKGYF